MFIVPNVFNIVLKVLVEAIKQVAENRGLENGKEEIKLSYMQMTWYCTREIPKILLEIF